MESSAMTKPLARGAAEKRRIALSSVVAAVFITLFKLIVGLQTNSLGILSEAAHSGLDFIAAFMTYIAVRIADRPPDREHPYGHGKIENLSAFLETLLLFATCAWIIWEALQRLLVRETHVESSVWAFVVVGTSIAVDISRSRALGRAARKYRSQALEADALHFSSDIWSSLVVLLGLIFVTLGYQWVDPIAAILVAILVLFVSYRLGRRTIDALMDRVPEGLHESVLDAVKTVSGVEEVRSVRIRASGSHVFVDMTIAIPRTFPFQLAHTIMDNVEQAVRERHDDVDVVVHAEPCESEEETIADKVRMIVLAKGLRSPHNLEVHYENGKQHVDFDIEYLQGKTFVEAHDVASDLEEEIRGTIPTVDRVTIHMEEFRPEEHHVTQAPLPEEGVLGKVRGVILEDARILRCESISLIPIGDQWNLTLDCFFERQRTLEEVHQIISQIENRLHTAFPELRRVTIHAEPV
jgi:cation diffusion facilitator family transporter